jgi:hypothetical protein
MPRLQRLHFHSGLSQAEDISGYTHNIVLSKVEQIKTNTAA